MRFIVHSMNYMPKKMLESIPEHQVEQFQGLIFKLYQCCQKRMHHQSEKFHIPDSELRCLRLFGQERYLTSKGIAIQMGVVKSRISKIINGLARRGLIQRYKDSEDSRVTLLSLTPKGQKKLNLINTYLFSANMDILFQISPEQRGPLLVHLEVLRAAMDSVSSK